CAPRPPTAGCGSATGCRRPGCSPPIWASPGVWWSRPTSGWSTRGWRSPTAPAARRSPPRRAAAPRPSRFPRPPGPTSTSRPASRGAQDELRHWGLTPVPVPVDADGLDVAALARTGESVVLVTPAHHFPTGVVLAPGRRRDLLAAAELVIEDDYDAEHRYDRA